MNKITARAGHTGKEPWVVYERQKGAVTAPPSPVTPSRLEVTNHLDTTGIID